MKKIAYTQQSFFDNINNVQENTILGDCDYISNCNFIENMTNKDLFKYYDKLNDDMSHATSRDDICTPMLIVQKMINYIPIELWNRKQIKILDPCCGNGNFGAYCQTKTNPNNIWYNDLNPKRLENCIMLINPLHINKEDYFNMTGEFDSKYDLIMANPPYSGGGNKNRSLSNKFIEESILRLKNNGYLCFITPNNWMTYNNNNTTLKKLLTMGSFITIDNTAKKSFPSIGSSFTIFVWQKNVFKNRTTVYNNYLITDIQKNIKIPKTLKFLPLYISQNIINIIVKSTQTNENNFKYRCDLHNFTQKALLSDYKDNKFIYETIHTPRKTRYALKKQDIYDKWLIIVPLTTYYIPYIRHNVNTTQSVGYFAFDSKENANKYMMHITSNIYKLIVHLTRYGNFNNIKVLKHLRFDENIELNENEIYEVTKLVNLIKY